MPLRNLVWLLVIPGVVGLGLAVGYSAPPPDQDYQLIHRVALVLAEVDRNYVRELNEKEREELVKRMINGGLRWLDPNSVYLDEEDLRRFEQDNAGSFEGIGVLPGEDHDKTTKKRRHKILHVVAGSPAYDAGLVVGDEIVKVGGEPTEPMTLPEMRDRIKGEKNTKVVLTIRRGGQKPGEFDVTITRGQIEDHPVTGVARLADDPREWNWFVDPQNKIAYIRVSTFSDLTTKELKAAIEKVEAAGAKGLILDLRENGGGLLTQSILVADLFLPGGKIVTTKDRRGGDTTETAKESGTLFLPAKQKPIVVLVNHHSASASEIVAAALQDNERAVVVGTRTYGKGSVQSTFRLGDDKKTAVKLTTQTWWRPSGKNMDKLGAPKDRPDEWGVTPDTGMAVAMTDVEYRRFFHELDKLHYVAGKPEVVKDVYGPNPPRPPVVVPNGDDGKPLWDESKPYEDPQLKRALEHLRKTIPGVGAAPGRGGFPRFGAPA
jgi:carboxyl-terminal processing protease